jgi:uncharacterized pyridoxamine 5'-phosphate oxidase family protein
MNWKSAFKKGKELILATSLKNGNPHANIVISLGFAGDKLLIADCQMKTTIKSIEKNKNVCVIGGYLRLKGFAKIFSSGKYFDLCLKENRECGVKSAILITVKEVFDLDKIKNII